MYEDYFGLTNLPFRLAPDRQFYVDTVMHRAALTALQARLTHVDEFLPLIGEYGTGKTLVGRRLLDELDHARQVGAELPPLRVEGDELFDRVTAAFGLPRDRSLRPLENAIRQFEGIVHTGREAVLLIDDAHLLDAAVVRRLRKLTAIRVDGRTALRVCLAGRSTPGFEELQRFGHTLSIGAPVELEPLDAEQTEAYILERLRRAGWQGRPDFSAATAAIHERCQGNLALVNRLCGHILLHLYMQGRNEVDAGIVHAVDDLLQAELRGEFATLALPPPEHPAPTPPLPTPTDPVADAALHGDALMARLIARSAEPTSMPIPLLSDVVETPLAVWVPTPMTVPAVIAPAASRRRHGVAQVVTALAFMVTGGFLWQMIINFAQAHADARQDAAPVVARAATPSPPAASEPEIATGPTALMSRED